MGIFSSLVSKAKGLVVKVAENVKAAPVTTALTLASPPLAAIAGYAGGATKKVIEKISQAKAVVTGAILGGVVAGPAGVVAGAAAGSALGGISYAETAPKTSKITQKIEELGFSSIESLEKTALEHPVETILLLGAAPAVAYLGLKTAGTLAKGVGAAVGAELAIEDLPKETESSILESKTMSTAPSAQLPPEKELKTDGAVPMTAQTQTIEAGSTKKRRHRASKLQKKPYPTQNIRQSVNLLVAQSGHYKNKRYLNAYCLN